MNDPSLNPTSEQELETRITAVVLGEASDFERDQVDRLICQRPELVAMKARFESMHRMLHDVGQEPWQAEGEGDWKLPAQQRAALLDVLAGGSGKSHVAVAPQRGRSAITISRFTKIGAWVCAACLLVALGVWGFSIPNRMVSTGTSYQIAAELPDHNFLEYQQLVSPPATVLERSSRPALRSGESGGTRQKVRELVSGLDGEMDGMGGGMGGMGGGMGGSMGMGVKKGMDVPVSDFSLPADATVLFSQSEIQPNGAPLPSEPAGGADGRWSETSPGLSSDMRSISGPMDPSGSPAAGQPSVELRIDESQPAGDVDAAPPMPAPPMPAPTAPPMAAPMTAAAKPDAPAEQNGGRAFSFSEPSEGKALRFDRSRLLEIADADSDGTASLEFAESKSMKDEAVRSESFGVTAGVNVPELGRQQTRELPKQLAAGGSEPQHAVEKLERKSDELFRIQSTLKAEQSGIDTAPESSATVEPFSTFSLHVSDVSFKLAAAALAQGQWPEASTVRIEEFVNAMDYGDPLPRQHEMVACQMEQSIDPFVQQRNLLRVSLRTAAMGRSAATPLRLTLLLDNSGSMERMDRQQTLRQAFEALVQQLQPSDQITLISFARTPRLLADRVSGEGVQELVQLIENLPSDGGTNIEAALLLAWEKAREQWTEGAQNRIILLTDGAVNLGDADPEQLSRMVTNIRETGIAFDAAGISANGLNDEVLEALTRQGDGRYYLLDSAESADAGFARQIAGALRPTAMNVKVQIEFNPQRVGHYRLLGFENHRLNQEDFRDDQVDAAELSAAEAGVAVYQLETIPDGEGDVGSVSVRFRDISTGQMIERRWPILYQSSPPRVDQSPASMRLATAASMFAAKLRGGPLGESVDLSVLSEFLAELPSHSRAVPRVQQLEQMIQQARQISGQ